MKMKKKTKMTKHPVKQNILATIQKAEKDLLTLPAQLATKTQKETAKLKKNETKLKSSIAKLAQQVKAADGKKLKKVKKIYDGAVKQFDGFSKELQILSAKTSKLQALAKHIRQFEKDWTKQPVSVKNKPKKVAKLTAKPISTFTAEPESITESRIDFVKINKDSVETLS